MRKTLTAIMTAALLVGSLALPACGNNATSTTGAEQGATIEEPTGPTEKDFVGTWKLAAAQSKGVTMTGDLSVLIDADESMTLEFKEGGTGSFGFAGESSDYTWKFVDGSAELTFASGEDASSEDLSDKTIKATLESDVLTLDMEEVFEAKMLFSKTGKIDGIFTIDASTAKAITNKDDVQGEWKLSGMGLMGVSVYGDADALSEMSGQTFDATLSLAADGTGTFSGSEVTWQTTADGTSITASGTTMPLKCLDDTHIILDVPEIVGMDIDLMYTK
jgi:hypothetical protein